jgi:hypothetical protein
MNSSEYRIESNQELEESNIQQEKDALEVIAALQRENETKDSQIKRLRDDIDKIQEQSLRKEAELKEWSDKRIEGKLTLIYRWMATHFS